MNEVKNTTILTELRDGQSGFITDITGGKALTKRLADLGLNKGTAITVIGRTLFSGPLQIEVCGSRLVIGKGLASKIVVEIK